LGIGFFGGSPGLEKLNARLRWSLAGNQFKNWLPTIL